MKINKVFEMLISKRFSNDSIVTFRFGGGREITIKDDATEEYIAKQEQELFREIYDSVGLDLASSKNENPIIKAAHKSVCSGLKQEIKSEKAEKNLDDYE